MDLLCALILTLIHVAPGLYVLWWDMFKREPSEHDWQL